MNPGELKEKISVLSINSSENAYTWGTSSSIWAKAEQLSGNNIFSKVGLGAKSIKFTIRKKSDLTLHNAFAWNGKHCFLTDIKEIDRAYYEVSAALVEPQICYVERMGEPTLNELKRPVYESNYTLSFPGCITEKYLGHSQESPMTTQEIRYVLVTPKVIILEAGELVTINNITYNVLLAHTLDEYKNEYEIMVKGDN